MSDQAPADRNASRLAAAYRLAERSIRVLLGRLLHGDLASPAQRRVALFEVQRILDDLAAATDPAVEPLIRQAVEDAARRTDAIIARLATPGTAADSVFSIPNQDAIRELSAALQGRLSAARVTIGRQAQDVFARAGRQAVLQGLLDQHGARRIVSRDIEQRLRRQGVTGFVDKAGRRWTLSDYAEMAARTTTREAVIAGQLVSIASAGVRVARVSTHASSCAICAPWEGKLVSLDGKAGVLDGETVYPPSDMPGLNGYPPFHPRCKHSLEPVVESLAGLAPADVLAGAA